MTNANPSPDNQSEYSRVKYAPVNHGQDAIQIIVVDVISSGDDLMADEHDVTKIVLIIFSYFSLLSDIHVLCEENTPFIQIECQI